MKQENPYQAPLSVAAPGALAPPRRWGVALVSLVVVQTLLALVYATTMVSHLRHGEISLLVFMSSALASLLLVTGGIFYAFKSRVAAYLFFASAACAAFVYLQWRPAFVLTGFAISACACLVSVVYQKRFAKV